jgi:hypothetical protein
MDAAEYHPSLDILEGEDLDLLQCLLARLGEETQHQ